MLESPNSKFTKKFREEKAKLQSNLIAYLEASGYMGDEVVASLKEMTNDPHMVEFLNKLSTGNTIEVLESLNEYQKKGNPMSESKEFLEKSSKLLSQTVVRSQSPYEVVFKMLYSKGVERDITLARLLDPKRLSLGVDPDTILDDHTNMVDFLDNLHYSGKCLNPDAPNQYLSNVVMYFTLGDKKNLRLNLSKCFLGVDRVI